MFRLKALLIAAPVAAGLMLAGTPARAEGHGGGGGFHGGGGGFHGGGPRFHGGFAHNGFRRGFGAPFFFGFGAGALLAAPYYYGWPPPYYPPPGCYPPPPGYPPGCYPPPPPYYPPG
jgi:hypothetical protein